MIETDACAYDWEMQWAIAGLLTVDSIPRRTINVAIRILTNPHRHNDLRATCAILVGKYGGGQSKTILSPNPPRESVWLAS